MYPSYIIADDVGKKNNSVPTITPDNAPSQVTQERIEHKKEERYVSISFFLLLCSLAQGGCGSHKARKSSFWRVASRSCWSSYGHQGERVPTALDRDEGTRFHYAARTTAARKYGNEDAEHFQGRQRG